MKFLVLNERNEVFGTMNKLRKEDCLAHDFGSVVFLCGRRVNAETETWGVLMRMLGSRLIPPLVRRFPLALRCSVKNISGSQAEDEEHRNAELISTSMFDRIRFNVSLSNLGKSPR